MSIPTTGTYSGISIYQSVPFSGLPPAVQQAVDAIAPLLDGSGLAIPSTLLVAVASNADVSFNGSSLSFTDNAGVPLTLDDSETFAQGPTGFGFLSDGTEYVLSNAPMPDVVTADAGLDYLADYYTASGNAAAAAIVLNAKAVIDLNGLGSVSFLVDAGIFNGEPYQPPCFARGTLIATPAGERAVEALEVGDRLVLARGGEAEIVWIGRRRVRIEAAEKPELQRPIRVTAGALGDGLPRRDLVVSPDHALFLDGVLVPAGLLVDGARIRPDAVESVEYFHVELAAHDLLLAEGTPAETYLDTGNRHTFANASLVTLRPDFSAGPARIGTVCAEMVLGGEKLDAIRSHLASLAPETVRRAS